MASNVFETFRFLYWQYSSPLHGKIWSCLRQFSFHFHFFVWQTKLCTLFMIRSHSAPMEWGPKEHGHHDMALFPLFIYSCTNSSCPHDLHVNTHKILELPTYCKSYELKHAPPVRRLNTLNRVVESSFCGMTRVCLGRKNMHSTFSNMFLSGHQTVKWW